MTTYIKADPDTRVARPTPTREQVEADTRRLDWLADEPIFDGLGVLDLHEIAYQVAVERGASDAGEAEYRVAFRRLIDAAIDAGR